MTHVNSYVGMGAVLIVGLGQPTLLSFTCNTDSWEASHVAYPNLDMLYHLWQKTVHVTGGWHCPSRAVR